MNRQKVLYYVSINYISPDTVKLLEVSMNTMCH